jgi:hypothetical protein
MNIYNPPTASQVIGLGTAALKNIGTSGSTVPVCNGAAVTWAAGADFAGNITARADINVWGSTGIPSLNISANTASGGGYLAALGTGDQTIRLVPLNSGGVQAEGAFAATSSRVGSFRIDQAAAAGALVQSHSITISANGTDYKLLATPA